MAAGGLFFGLGLFFRFELVEFLLQLIIEFVYGLREIGVPLLEKCLGLHAFLHMGDAPAEVVPDLQRPVEESPLGVPFGKALRLEQEDAVAFDLVAEIIEAFL